MSSSLKIQKPGETAQLMYIAKTKKAAAQKHAESFNVLRKEKGVNKLRGH